MQLPEPQKQHRWLQQLLGEWTFESEASMGPDQPSIKHTGQESVRALGEIWIVAEGRGEMGLTQMSLGYDARTQRFVGAWIGSMMTHLWVYDGALDAAEKKLTLECEGPSMTGGSELGKYRDVIEIIDADHRTLSAYFRAPDEKWTHFMTTHYHRVK